MTSLKGNPEKQRLRNLHAKALNESRTGKYRQQIVPSMKRHPCKKFPRQRINLKDIDLYLEEEE